VISAHVWPDEISQRWRADRWMKMKHFPAAALQPRVLRHGRRMLAHFTGSRLR
jgi:hypothetical protein